MGSEGSLALRAYSRHRHQDIRRRLLPPAIRGSHGEGMPGIKPGSSDPQSSPLPLRHRGGPFDEDRTSCKNAHVGAGAPTACATYRFRTLIPIEFELGSTGTCADDPYCSVGQWFKVKVTQYRLCSHKRWVGQKCSCTTCVTILMFYEWFWLMSR